MPKIFLSKTFQVIIGLVIGLSFYFFLPTSVEEPMRRMIVIFVVAAMFWAFETIPLYATSLLVVFSEIIFLGRPDGVLQMDRSGYQVFLLPFGSPIIVLFLGGFVLARALHKYGVDQWIAIKLLRFFGNKPYRLMLGFMMTTAFLSMWMSDTATTAMMIAMVIPLLKQLDEKNPFRTGLILAIPFSALIGGMSTPVGTPPNAIAIGALANQGIVIEFLDWMKMALPLAGILLMVASVIVYRFFPSTQPELNFSFTSEKIFTKKSRLVLMIVIGIIGLWLTSSLHHIPSDVTALLGVVVFSATGLLNKEDIKSLNWDILILMWGGLALGSGLEMSGVAQWIVQQPIFAIKGHLIIIIFCVLGAFLSTFMSNTATANLLLPIALAMSGLNPIILAVCIALTCSLAMTLPVSTPPNAIAFSTDMLKSRDMIKTGFLISLISVMIISLGAPFVLSMLMGWR